MSTPHELTIHLDHLVLATDNLIAGANYVEQKFGVSPDPGGRHDGWGTHNLLLNIGSGCYLELIAPDPSQPAPAGPRPFGLDGALLRERIAVRPRLVHFVTRSGQIEQATQRLGYTLPAPRPMSRDSLRWQLALNDMHDSVGVQLLPSMINWGNQQPPGFSLPARGVILTTLHLRGPAPLPEKLAPLGADRRVEIAERVSPMLTAEFQTPKGWAILD